MGATKIPPNVPRAVLDLDRPRTMVLWYPALMRLQEHLSGTDDALDMKNLPTLIWCGLIDEDREDVTPEDLQLTLHAGNIEEVSEAVSKLWDKSSSRKRAEGNEVPAPPEVKAGKKTKK